MTDIGGALLSGGSLATVGGTRWGAAPAWGQVLPGECQRAVSGRGEKGAPRIPKGHGGMGITSDRDSWRCQGGEEPLSEACV